MGTFGGALGRPSGTFGRCPGFPGGLGVLWRSLASPGEPQVPPGDPMRFQGVPGDPMIENRTGSLAFWGDKGRTLLKNIGFLKVLKGTTGLSRGPPEAPRGSSGASRGIMKALLGSHVRFMTIYLIWICNLRRSLKFGCSHRRKVRGTAMKVRPASQIFLLLL